MILHRPGHDSKRWELQQFYFHGPDRRWGLARMMSAGESYAENHMTEQQYDAFWNELMGLLVGSEGVVETELSVDKWYSFTNVEIYVDQGSNSWHFADLPASDPRCRTAAIQTLIKNAASLSASDGVEGGRAVTVGSEGPQSPNEFQQPLKTGNVSVDSPD